MSHDTLKQLVDRYTVFEMSTSVSQKLEYIIDPATDVEIEILRAKASARKLTLDEDYINFLRIRNGTSYNGLMLYGACILADDPARRGDICVMNDYSWNRGGVTILGTSDLDAYVITRPNGPFQRLDRSCWDVIESYQTCNELLYSIFEYQLEILRCDE